MAYLKIYDENIRPIGVVDKDKLSSGSTILVINDSKIDYNGEKNIKYTGGIYNIAIVTPYKTNPKDWTATNIIDGSTRTFSTYNTQSGNDVLWKNLFVSRGALIIKKGTHKVLTIDLSSYYNASFIGSLD